MRKSLQKIILQQNIHYVVTFSRIYIPRSSKMTSAFSSISNKTCKHNNRNKYVSQKNRIRALYQKMSQHVNNTYLYTVTSMKIQCLVMNNDSLE